MRLLMLSGIVLGLTATSASADSANSDWNNSAGFQSSAEMLVLMHRFKLRQMIPTGFSTINNTSIGSITNVNTSGDNNTITPTITTTVSGTVHAEQDSTLSEYYD